MQYHQHAKRIRSEVPPCCQKHNYMAHASCSCLWIRGAAGSCYREEWLLLMQGCQSPSHGSVWSPGAQLPRQFLLSSIFQGGCSPHLSLPGRREHMAAYLCSAVLTGLVGLWSAGARGDLPGERARRDLERVGCIHGKWSGTRVSVVCHNSN